MTITINWATVKPYVTTVISVAVGYVVANPDIIPATYRPLVMALVMGLAAQYHIRTK
jgi:hypothetical protein